MHVINLVITDTSQCLTDTISYFSLLLETHTLFKVSYKRLVVYKEENPTFQPASIGITRWRSQKDNIEKIFGYFDSWINDGSSLATNCHSHFVYLELMRSVKL